MLSVRSLFEDDYSRLAIRVYSAAATELSEKESIKLPTKLSLEKRSFGTKVVPETTQLGVLCLRDSYKYP